MSPYETALLALAILVGLSVRLAFFTGTIASDDLTYADAARYMFSTEHERPFADGTAGSVPIRRLGVNLPLFCATRVFGVHEWSLALVPLVFSLGGIIAAYATARLLAGSGAGMLAAWLWACLPADVYTATIWLPDNIFATVCMVMTYFLVASEAWSCRRWLAALLAGVTLGYLEYVKEAAYIFLLPLLAWEVYAVWRTRQIDWRPAYILAGFVFVQGLASVYFWTQGGDPLVFWQETFNRYADMMFKEPPPRPYPANLAMGQTYLLKQWILGYAVVLFPVLMLAALADRRIRFRGRLFVLLLLQTYIVLEGWKLGAWTQRYILHATATIILFSALGIHALLSRLPARWGRWTVPAASVGLVAATACALRPQWQQHGRFRADALRHAHTYLAQAAGPADVIYTDLTRKIHYASRTFELLSGYEPFKGGFQNIDRAYDSTAGWVLVTHWDAKHPSRDPARRFRGVAPNWLEVFRAQDKGGAYFASVYRILPSAVPPFVSVVTAPGGPAIPVDVSAYRFEPLALTGSPADWLSRQWSPEPTCVDMQVTADGLRCTVRAAPPPASATSGGVQFSVSGLTALRLDMELSNPTDVEKVYVYLYGEKRGEVAKYQWRPTRDEESSGARDPLVILPGRPSAPFKLNGEISPADVRTAHVFVRVAPGATAGFNLRRIELATPGQTEGPRESE